MRIRSQFWRWGYVFAMAAGLLLTQAAADDRLSGYWVAAPEQPNPAVVSIGQLGKWTMMTQHWVGASEASPELKVRYLAATEGNHGTLTADQNLDKLPEAPRTITYQIDAGKLTLTVTDSVHAGTYVLVKGTPPAHAAPVQMVNLTPLPHPAPPPATPTKQGFEWPRLIGGWVAEPQSNMQIDLFISRNPKAGQDVFKVNQRWTKGSDNPVMSRGVNYVGSVQGDHGVLAKDKPDFEGSEIPLTLNFKFEGDKLVVTVDGGACAGQYSLVRGTK